MDKDMADPLLHHRHPHEHRHCTPRRQLVSIRQASGDDPEYVVNLDERRPVIIAAMRDVDQERHETALRCLQERTLSVAAAEAEKRPPQEQAAARRPVVGFPQQAVSRRPRHDFGTTSMGPFSTYTGVSQSSDRPVFGFSQAPASRRARRASGTPCVRPCTPPSGDGRAQDLAQGPLHAPALGFPQTAVCRRHRQEFAPSMATFATFASAQSSHEYPGSSNIRPDGHY